MMKTPELKTQRLVLRQWQANDQAPFADLNTDTEVMRYFPQTLSRAESDALVQRINQHWNAHGFGLWAVERRETHDFIGFVGFMTPSFHAHFTPCVEISWRLAHHAWGHGYATEAAKVALQFAFAQLQLSEVVSFTVPHNTRSRAVMQRLGMHHSPQDNFLHPRLPQDHPLCHHVLYRISAAQFLR
jgi:RimJ/RimL family protein N-acetyltransferase